MSNTNNKIKKTYLFSFCFLFITLIIAIKLFYLTVLEHKDYNEYNGQKIKKRGIIYDSQMREIAINIPSYTIYLDKALVSNKNDNVTLSNISVIYSHIPEILDISENELTSIISEKRRTVTLALNVDTEIYNKILEIKKQYGLRSIYGVETFKRFYPYSDIFAHIVGYMNKTGTEGYTGLEATYENILSSDNDNGKDIILTLDRDVQTIVRNELLKFVSEVKVQSASVILTEVKSGKIIANYTYPSFDPNNPFIYSSSDRMDKSIMSTIYPASSMKIFASLAALEEGVVTLDEEFYCIGYYDYSEKTRINCDYPHGVIKGLEDILKYSCNSAIVTIAERIDKEFYYNYLKRFGFGEITGVGPYKYEWSGKYHNLKDWHGYSKGYLAIGYDLSTTPMQIAASYLPLLNGGGKVQMHVVDAIFDENKIFYTASNHNNTQIIDNKYSQVAKYLLRQGVETGATGSRADLVNIDVIGKTGTAITEVSKKYSSNEVKIEKYYQSLFIGGFPLEEPKYSMLVLLDGPETKTSRAAGALVAPLFAKIANQVIPYLDIINNRLYTINTNNFSNSIPTPTIKDEDIMSDIMGYSLRDALATLTYSTKKYDATISIQGEGYIVNYLPKKGEQITNNQIFYLMLMP